MLMEDRIPQRRSAQSEQVFRKRLAGRQSLRYAGRRQRVAQRDERAAVPAQKLMNFVDPGPFAFAGQVDPLLDGRLAFAAQFRRMTLRESVQRVSARGEQVVVQLLGSV